MRTYMCKTCGKLCHTSDRREKRGRFCSLVCYYEDKRKVCKGRSFARPCLNNQTVHIPPDSFAVGYLAGLIDGEGSIMSIKNNYAVNQKQWRIAIYNTDIKMINWIRQTFGGGYVKIASKGKSHVGPNGRDIISTKDELMWTVRSYRDVLAVLKTIEPYLITKHTKALTAISYIENRIQNYEKERSNFRHPYSLVEAVKQ